MKTLVVDDIAYSRLIVRKTLEQSGLEVIEASSGAEALCALEKESDISLVISDLKMPDMDGTELLERARSLDPPPEVDGVFPPPFILLTASLERNAMSKVKQAGFVDIMVKPPDPIRLLKAVERCVGNGLEQVCDRSVTLQDLTTAVSRTIEAEDREGAEAIRQSLQESMEKIDAFLQSKAGEKKTEEELETEKGDPS